MKTEWMAVLALLVVFGMAAGCQSTSVPPTQAANEVAALLVAGDVARAEEQFAGIEGEEDLGLAYALLYGQAQTMWEQRDYASCIRINRFLVRHYPDESSASSALLYALFMNRARTGKVTDEATRREMTTLGSTIRKAEKNPPVWVDLALAQVAIDGGDLAIARASAARFRARWNGSPASLRDYAQELDRWIATHAQSSPLID